MEQRVVAGRYRLQERIAAGGMGTVWRAYDAVLQRPVAVKLLNEGLGSDPTASARLRREALNAAQVIHPNIASIFDYVEENAHPSIVMELVEGETLAQRLTRDGKLSHAEAVRITRDVLAALQAAHDSGIVHRDIKPGNILLTPDGTVKVTDFGIARSLGDASMTATGTVMGTAHYTAPEQIRGAPATPSSDIYATGVLLYEMLTGRRPFVGETPVAVAMARLERDPDPPRSIDPTIPAATDDVVMRSLARAPEQRFPSAAAMQAALEAAIIDTTTALGTTRAMTFGPSDPTVALGAMGGLASDTSPPTTGPLPVSSGAPRRRLAPMILLPAIIAALVGFWLVVSLSGGDSATARSSPSPSEVLARQCCAVPNLRGMTLERATAAAEARELTVEVKRYEITTAAPAGTVIRQSPGPRTRLEEGDAIEVVLARAPAPDDDDDKDKDEDKDDDKDDDKGSGKGRGKGRD